MPGDFCVDAVVEARRAARSVALPDDDATDIPLVTVDPTGSRDLDQAVHLARRDEGYLVSYAIADVGSYVVPGGAVDAEAHRRGETLYFPDARVPLHPPELSEAAASLLPHQVRPAVLWQITLAGDGSVSEVTVRRARVRSTAQLDYAGVQQAMDAGSLPEPIAVLREVGEARLSQGRSRHAINLDLPEQLVERDGVDGWRIALRAQSAVEIYNAEISLLTGMCAAQIMLRAGIGILRTVPPADPRTVDSMRRAARALGIAWPAGAAPGDVLARIDRTSPRHVAFLEHAVTLLRGAAYTLFDGAPPHQSLHAGIGAPYAHVTAPLRRLVDRYGSEVCLAWQAGQPVPHWVRAALPELPGQMRTADQRAHAVDRAVVDTTEAWLLRDRIGTDFDAIVIDSDEHAGTVVLDEPAVRGRCAGENLPVGERIRARLTVADVVTREVRFARA